MQSNLHPPLRTGPEPYNATVLTPHRRTWHGAAALAGLCAALLSTGCANVSLPPPSASPANVEALRAATLAPVRLGTFALAPGKPASMDNSLPGLRGVSLAPPHGSFARLLRDTLSAELSAAGLLDDGAGAVIEGLLTDSMVDAAIVTGTGRLAARFTVKRGGSTVFDRELAVEERWPSSFIGAEAVPTALNQYSALYRKLVAALIADPQFKAALKR